MRVDHWASIRDRSTFRELPRPHREPSEPAAIEAPAPAPEPVPEPIPVADLVDTIADKQKQIDVLYAEIDAIAGEIGCGRGHRIARAIAKAHGVTWNDFISERRDKKLAVARHHAMYEVRKHTTMSLPAIGKMLGGRDHTTVLHGIRRHHKRMMDLGVAQ